MTFSTIPDTSLSSTTSTSTRLPPATALCRHGPPRAPAPPAATKPRPAPSWPRSARSRPSSRPSGPPPPRSAQVLARFPGFGPVALGIFPDPVTGRYKDATWQTLGEELRTLLTPEDYASARRTTFTAFYTSPVVIQAMHAALAHLGVPADATVLEPGCGIGNFMAQAPAGMRFIGVELDRLSGRIARVLLPRPRHPHRTLPRHPPARGPHRRRHRQCALRRSPPGLPRDAPRPA